MISFSDLPLNDELTEKLGNLNIDFAFQPVFRNSTLEKVGHEALILDSRKRDEDTTSRIAANP